MPSLFALKDFATHARLRWAALALLVSVIVFLVFIHCLQIENTRCAAISGLVGVASLCTTTWHGLIYIAGRRGGY